MTSAMAVAQGPLAIVGREAELGTVDALLAGLRAGRGGLLLVTGEPGIGKTRLAEEAIARAAARGYRTSWAATWEGAGAPPLWLWSQLLRDLTGSADLLVERAAEGTDGADLTRAAEAARFRQFDGVATILQDAARHRPLVVVFDDVQWADVASLRLLAFVAGLVRPVPCLIIGTARSGEMAPDDMATLSRHGATLALGGLLPDAVEAVLTAIVGSAVSTAAVDVVASRTGGNPLFVSELARLMRSSGRTEVSVAAIPPAVAAVVERRLARLSEMVVTCLQAAAVAGTECSTDDVDRMLAATSGEHAPAAVALAKAEAAAIVVRTATNRFAFSHDLVREALITGTPRARREALHRQAARECSTRAGSDPWAGAATAAHLEAAGSADAASPWWERAASAAIRMLAYEQAAAWLARARAGATGVRHLDLLLSEADARLRAGQLRDARALFRAGAAEARATSVADRLATAVLGIGVGAAAWEVPIGDEDHVELLEEAVATAPADDPVTRSTLLARLSVAQATPENVDRSRSLAEEALTLAREAPSPLAEAQALAALCDALAGPEYAGMRRVHAAAITKLAEAAGERALALLGRRFAIVACLELGDFPALDAEIARFVSAVDKLRQPLLSWYGPLFLGMRALLRSDLDEADRRRLEVEAAAERTGSANAALLAATLGLGVDEALGRPVPAGLFEGIVDADPAAWASYAAGIAYVAAQRGDRSGASALLHLHAADGFTRIGNDAEHLSTLTMFGRVAVWLGDLAAAAVVREMLLPHSGLWVVDGIAARAWGPVDLELARLEAALGRIEDAAGHITSARPTLAAAGASLLEDEADELDKQLNAPRPHSPVGTDDHEPAAPHYWRRDGEWWTLHYDNRTVRMKDAKGLADIARLLAKPGREVPAADLYEAPEAGRLRRGGGMGEILDGTARTAYRQRLLDVEEELADAEAMHDPGRAEQAHAERDFLAAELAAALGLGGRARIAGNPSERARKAITNRVRLAIDRIAMAHPALGHHLRHSIHTGTFCAYKPEHPVHWQVDAAP